MSHTIADAPAVTRPREGAARGWSAYLVAVAVVAIATGALAPTAILPWILVQSGAALAVLTGLRRHRLHRIRAWRILTTAVLLTWAATTFPWAIGYIALGNRDALDVYEIMIMVSYTLGAVAMVLLVTPAGRARWSGLVDAAIIGTSVAMPYWALFIDPMIDRLQEVDQDPLFSLIVPVMDLFLLGMLVRLAFYRGRAPWMLLFMGSYLALIVGDTANLVDQAAGRPAGAVATIGWMLWSGLAGATALHPSVRRAGERLLPPIASVRAGTTFYLVLALLSPIGAMAARALRGAPDDQAYDPFVIPILTVLLAVLLVLRLSSTARLAESRAVVLNRQAEQLAAQAAELSATLQEQEQLQEQLSYRATHDPLTGLANRILLTDALQRTLTENDRPPALLMLDMDGFKDVNDTFGHQAGDELLTQVAQRLREIAPPDATLARLGGDEFALMLPRADAPSAVRVADRVVEALRAPYPTTAGEFYLTVSMGVLADSPAASASEALRDADLALYAAKSAGKDQFVRFEPGLRQARLDQTRLTTGLRRALTHDEFTLNYQPVVDLNTGEAHAVEALLRWTPPGRAAIPPDRFIPIAEESGLIVPIGAWVLDRACADVGRWYRRHGVSVTVNVSGRQLREPAFSATVLDALRRHRLPERALILEITESMLLAGTPAETRRVVATLTALREQGIRIALDDFGTGYSSLAYLRVLPVDILKIDRAFATGVEDREQREARAFTKAILTLSSSLDLRAVVEGVESREQAEALREMGCPLAQGYLFSRPVPADEIDAFLDGGGARLA
ncbi:putative bifunctional diguanylate cyclase/phosphodiesterase [Spirillospora albida]|uniref:putative bifunctional diguanylate cyclase/phosphodiesterase n=1 Tax=Spirillospora albida TaxID=58123 RepID=UPI00068F4420|nr:bifunctional diguanylate cyclase/phosphodiesterase [Spirillospora albida]